MGIKILTTSLLPGWPLNIGTRLRPGETQANNTQFQRIVRSTQGGRQVERIEWVRVTIRALHSAMVPKNRQWMIWIGEYRRQPLKEMSFQQDGEAYGKNENALSLRN